MPDVMPHEIANAIMGKLYDVLTNGDETVPKSEDNFFTWCTPGIPMDVSDFEFLSQGLTGVVKKQALQDLTLPPSGTGGGTGSSGGSSAPSGQPEITPELLAQLRAQDTARLYMQA